MQVEVSAGALHAAEVMLCSGSLRLFELQIVVDVPVHT